MKELDSQKQEDPPPRGSVRIEQLPDGLLELRLEGVEVLVAAGPDQGQKDIFCLPRIRLGSGPENDLVLTDLTVSPRHAEIDVSEEGLLLRDLGSVNGTFVGDQRITEAVVPAGTRCRLGDTSLTLGPRTECRRSLVLEEDRLGGLVGSTPAMRKVFSLLRTLAPTPITVFLAGESGTGKELAARCLHELSGRDGELVMLDVGEGDAAAVRGRLFGQSGGNGPEARGAFRRAHRGTLLLNRVEELVPEDQERLLGTILAREVTPAEGEDPEPVDVRLVVAAHRDLRAEVEEGRFLVELYRRVGAAPIELPPLRERLEDLDLLISHLLEALGLSCRLTDATRAALLGYPWPGNVRELRGVLERAGVLAGKDEIELEHLGLPESSIGE